MIWIKIILIVLAFIGHIIIGYSIPRIKNRKYEIIKEFHEIIEKEKLDPDYNPKHIPSEDKTNG